MKSYENKFTDCKKDKDGFTKIRIRLYSYVEYMCVLAKPIPLTDPEAKKQIKHVGIREAKRLNLTLWKLKSLPDHAKDYGFSIDCTSLMYFNGAECAWKFYDEPDFTIEDDDLSEGDIDQLESEDPWFEPHNDDEGNYGDETVHAVYDL